MPIIAFLAVLLAAVVGQPSLAQTGPSPVQPQAAPAAAAQPAGDGALRALLEALRDDAARARLVDELERLTGARADAASPEGGAQQPAAAEGAAPPAADAPAPSQAPSQAASEAAATPGSPSPDAGETGAQEGAPQSVGRALAILTREIWDEALERSEAFLNGLSATERRLRAISGERGQALLQAGRELATLIVATVVVYIALRWLARRMFAGMRDAARDATLPGRGALWVGGVLIDALTVVIAWAIGNAISYFAIDSAVNDGVRGPLYLNAFLIVQMVKVAIRSITSPEIGALRLAPFDNAAARYWTGRFSGLVSILGYGLLLVTPIVNETVSIFTGRAVQVVVYALVLIWSMALVIRHRKAPSAWLRAKAEAAGGDATLRVIAAAASLWHWPAMAFLLLLFTTAVSSSGAVEPILAASARVAAVLALGAGAGVLAARAARHGVRLPENVSTAVPLLEGRLNGFLVQFLGVLRFLLTIATIGFAIDIAGLYDVGGWFARRFGEDFASATASVMIIVVMAFLLWLAIASWVDYRLNPERAEAATSREQTLLTLMRNAVTIALIIITSMFVLSELGIDIAPLLASAGVLGLAIGFGAQKLVQDIITGVFIQFESAINVGDVITVAGTTGAVEKLTIRSVSLRALDGTFHIIPFSSVDMVSNFNRGFAFHVADVGIAYRENIDDAKEAMTAAFDDLRADPAQRPLILGAMEWFGVQELGDSAVVLRARIRTRPGAQWGVGRAYNEAVKKRLDAAGIEIPFPHTTIWFGENRDGTAPPMRMVSEGAARRGEAPGAPTLSVKPIAGDIPDADGPER
ncbi:mechanosensitive ion channel domain-containing protein [Rubrimonas cliftonensis]|uniref:Small conductance mechanosensitive channel n=1 Tax=Rubrimonas cliftonensis TaxID=89524 RepID=A0A1H4C585_9RHOB|nr:mechanosensitive ion channel domain-containing protein [Rubrimonas cliftonensis]SEA55497.1 small conductance mechanosensitive channel [Rubrimonas cliftonensis]